MKNKLLILLAAGSAMVSIDASAAPFINGGFESASVDPGAGFVTLGAGSTAITGWQVIGASVDYIGGYWQPAEGSRSVDLNGNGTGGIQQTFDTVTGKSYRINFSLAGNPDGGPSTKTVLTVGTGGGAQTDTFDVTGNTRASMGWSPYSYVFQAGGTTSTISFTSLTPGAYGAALDAVSVSAIPEPATWGMMMMGFGAIGGTMRYRRRGTKVAYA